MSFPASRSHDITDNIFGDNTRIHQGDVHNHSSDQTNRCLTDLRPTDPRHDKTRIEQTKGGLLKDSYRWILENENFQRWRGDEHSHVLWVKGDPGKGKTMLLCGIIDELMPTTKLADSTLNTLLSYFFCQATDPRINSAVAVLRGLIYLLVHQQPFLITHLQKEYDNAGASLFTDFNAWVALSEILREMLGDTRLGNVILIIDALDECIHDLPHLLDLISKASSASSRTKWIVSSRNWPSVEHRLNLTPASEGATISLEVNADLVSSAVDAYISYNVSQLESIQHDIELQTEIQQRMRQKANGTFLWVALVFGELKGMDDAELEDDSDILTLLDEVPSDLTKLYSRMLQQLGLLKNKDPELCRTILSTVASAYRPLNMGELAVIAGLKGNLTHTHRLERLVKKCGSFLTVRNATVYFVHQSAKEHLIENETARRTIFLSGSGDVHRAIFSRSLQAMSEKLTRNIYHLQHSGALVDEIEAPQPDPLTTLRYSCVYWASHLCEENADGSMIAPLADLGDNGRVHEFIQTHFLHWLEALSLLRGLSDGVVLITRLGTLLKKNLSQGNLCNLIKDARRFILYNKYAIEVAPLQIYTSALLFSPLSSLIRQTFNPEELLLHTKHTPMVNRNWSPCLQTLEGHTNYVESVAISADSKHIASASYDSTVRLWDAATGSCIHILGDHEGVVTSVAFSADSQRVASGSWDMTVKIWDVATGVCVQTLVGHIATVESVAFSAVGQYVISGARDMKAKMWDSATGDCLQTLEGHTGNVESVAFSADGQRIVSASGDFTIKTWDTATGVCLQTLMGHGSVVKSAAFSTDGRRIASGSWDETVKIWDATTGSCIQTLEGHNKAITEAVFSADSRYVASSSWDGAVKLWDIATGACLQTLKGHLTNVESVVFSADGQIIVSGSSDGSVKMWDVATVGYTIDDETIVWETFLDSLEDHASTVESVVFSPDGGRIVSGSSDALVKVWDAATGDCLRTLEGHKGTVSTISFSTDSKYIVSGSWAATVKLWDAATGACLRTMKGHIDYVRSVVFSADGNHIASGSMDSMVKIWSAVTGVCLRTLGGHQQLVDAVAFSADGERIASGSWDETVRIWDVSSGALIRTLSRFAYSIQSVAFSADGQRVAIGSTDRTVEVWDTTTGDCLHILDIGRSASYLAFDSITHSRLYTDFGCLDLQLASDSGMLPASTEKIGFCGYDVDMAGAWIQKDGKPLLWLPQEYRGLSGCSAVLGSTVVIGCHTGRVLVFNFSDTSDC